MTTNLIDFALQKKLLDQVKGVLSGEAANYIMKLIQIEIVNDNKTAERYNSVLEKLTNLSADDLEFIVSICREISYFSELKEKLLSAAALYRIDLGSAKSELL